MWGNVNSSFCRTAKCCSCFWNILRHKIKYWDNWDVAGSNASFIFLSLSPYSFVEFSFQLNMLKLTTKLNTLGLSSSTSLSSICLHTLAQWVACGDALRVCSEALGDRAVKTSDKAEDDCEHHTHIFLSFFSTVG